jgi:hypothetical protein
MKNPIVAIAVILLLIPTAARTGPPERTVRFEQVLFRYDPALASAVDARMVPAVPLEDPSDVPDGVGPEHLLFTFRGGAGPADSLGRDPGAIRIYPVREYEEIWPPCKESVDALRILLAERPAGWKREIPFLPWADVAQPFRTHGKYIEFRDGLGIGFVTAYAIEPSPITNRALVYTFQGLTADGETYVSLSFPIAAPILNENEGVDDWEAFLRGYDAYVEDWSGRLGGLPPDAFTPDLDRIEAMIRSLCTRRSECAGAEKAR